MISTLLPVGDDGASEEILDAVNAAEYLGCTRIYVDKLIRTGHLPAHRVGQHWIIRVRDLESWAKANPADGKRGVRHAETTQADLRALAAIAKHPGLTAVGLSHLSGEPRRTCLERLQRLDRQGLITRHAVRYHEPHQCQLTDAGWEQYHSHTAPGAQADSA
ncbi:MAG: excisionase family DNA-binding protein [Acidimicrobiales bacterium]